METVLAHLGPRQACGLVLGKPAESFATVRLHANGHIKLKQKMNEKKTLT